MPSQKPNAKCIQCDNNESPMWRILENGHICHSCYEENKNNIKNDLEPEANENSNGNGDEKKLRKSTRSTRYKSKTTTVVNAKNITKGKNRRNIFKKNPTKAPVIASSTTFVENLFYKGSYMQIGDIVSLADFQDNIYYAQIRGLLVDTYSEKSAFITWLIPTKASPPPNERFDPSTYLIGPEEDSPRKLSCLVFVMHAPSNYYYNRNMPYPPPDGDADYEPNNGFIWTNIIPNST